MNKRTIRFRNAVGVLACIILLTTLTNCSSLVETMLDKTLETQYASYLEDTTRVDGDQGTAVESGMGSYENEEYEEYSDAPGISSPELSPENPEDLLAAELAEQYMQAAANQYNPAGTNYAENRQTGSSAYAIDAGRAAVPADLPEIPPAPQIHFTPYTLYNTEQSTAAEKEKAKQEALRVQSELQQEFLGIEQFGPASFEKEIEQVFSLAESIYTTAKPKLEADSLAQFTHTVLWTPDFSPAIGAAGTAQKFPGKAQELSLAVTIAISHLDRPYFIQAFAAAVFALDKEDPIAAGNLASAVIAAGERLYPNPGQDKQLSEYRKQAITLYRYAIACSTVEDKGRKVWSLRSLTPLINLGNLLIDMKEYEEAKRVLVTAREIDPSSWPAALALASCYEALHRPLLARAVLEDKALERPVYFAAMQHMEEERKQIAPYTGIPIDSSEELYNQAFEVLEQQEIRTAADFIGSLDQNERNTFRNLIKYLPPAGSFSAPEISLLTPFSSVRTINEPLGQAAVKDFSEALGAFALQRNNTEVERQLNQLEQLGMSINYGLDLKDVLAHPEKYEDRDIEVTVEGEAAFRENIEELEKLATQAELELATGKTSGAVALGKKLDPAFGIFTLNPANYANPMDIAVQAYNLQQYFAKYNLYGGYLYKITNDTKNSVVDIIRNYGFAYGNLQLMEDGELKALDEEIESVRMAGGDPYSAEWKLKEHAIHQKYAVQYNHLAIRGWNQATSIASAAYLQRIKPRAEAMYYDMIRNVAMISDPHIRQLKDTELKTVLLQNLALSLHTVLIAYAGFYYIEDWDCGCDVGTLKAQYEEEQAALRKIENERLARAKGEKKRFDAGKIPESSPLFKKLDSFGTDLTIPFIPFMSGKITCAQTIVNFHADLSSMGGPNLKYGFKEDAFTGTSTHSGGMELGFSRSQEGLGASATLSLSGSVTRDSSGVVTDYSVKGAAAVSIEAGGTSVSAGVEASTGSGGVIEYDSTVSAKGGLSGKLVSAEVSIEASVQRGNSLSGKVEADLNISSSEMNQSINDALGDIGEAFPVDTSVKKELWSGTFPL